MINATKKAKKEPGKKKQSLSEAVINKQLEEFCKLNEPQSSRSSILDRYERIILILHRDNYSFDQIVEFLNAIGVNCHRTTVGRFIRRKSAFYEKENNKIRDTETIIKTQHGNSSRNGPLISIDSLKRTQETGFSFSPASIKKDE